MFAFANMTWWQILLGLMAVCFLLRVSRRGTARSRRRFPWKGAALVVLTVVAVKHFGGPKFSFTFDSDQPRIAPMRNTDGGFPAVKQKDLWAMRRATDKKADKKNSAEQREKRAREIERRVAEVEDRADEVAQHAAEIASRNARIAEANAGEPVEAATEPVAVSPHIPADVVETVAEARDLARRAIDEGRAIYAKAKRDAKALAVMARKQADAEASAASPASPAPTATVPASPGPSGAGPVVAAPPASAPGSPASPAPEAPPAVAVESSVAPRSSDPAASTPERAKAENAKETKPPPWVNAPPGRDRDVYYTTVVVGPHKDAQACEDELSAELQKAVNSYVDNYLGPGASQTFEVPQAFIHDQIVKHPYYFEKIDFTEKDPLLGEMVNLHARLAFDGRVRAQLQRMWRDAQVENRLLGAGLGAGAILLVLGTIFGYLKLDTLTRGYYTRRLQFAAATVILATAAAAGATAVRTARMETGRFESHSTGLPFEVRSELAPAGHDETTGLRLKDRT